MKFFTPILLTLVLTACGGGGGGGSSATSSPTANTSASHSLSVVLNYSSTATSYNSAVGDLNGDGLEDVVIGSWSINAQQSRIFVFVQNIDGTMSDHTQQYLGTTTIQGSQHVFIADFDGDGRNDILIPGFADGNTMPSVSTYIFWNNSNQQFIQQTVAQTMAHGACVGDLNADGKLDFMAAGFNGGGAFINNGNRSFTLNTTLLNGNTYFSACAIEQNTDGTISIAYGNHGIPGHTQGNLITSDTGFNLVSIADIIDYPAGDLIDMVAIDMNLDGKTDFVAIYNAPMGSLAKRDVLLNNGDDTFTYSQTLDNLGNDYCAYPTSVNGQPAIYFSGNATGNRIYTITNTAITAYKPSAFTDMATLVSGSNQAQAGVPYHGAGGNLYMLQFLNLSTFYTEAM